MNNLFDINGNVTVITGGTGVLGRTIAKYLALNGAKDTQVDPSNLDVIQRLNPAAETVTLDGHNHLFQADAVTGLLQEYATLPGDISPLTLATIARWLERRVK